MEGELRVEERKVILNSHLPPRFSGNPEVLHFESIFNDLIIQWIVIEGSSLIISSFSNSLKILNCKLIINEDMCSGQDLNLHALASQASEACVYTVPPPEQGEEEENNFLSAVKVPPTYVGGFFIQRIFRFLTGELRFVIDSPA